MEQETYENTIKLYKRLAGKQKAWVGQLEQQIHTKLLHQGCRIFCSHKSHTQEEAQDIITSAEECLSYIKDKMISAGLTPQQVNDIELLTEEKMLIFINMAEWSPHLINKKVKDCDGIKGEA